MTHTFGEWHAHNLWVGHEGNGPYAYPLGRDPETAVANARLIAAAPDLYAAACAFLDVVGDATDADLDRLTLQFAAAVTKARGEQ